LNRIVVVNIGDDYVVEVVIDVVVVVMIFDILTRAFDHNGDGSISQGELREAMTRFGQTFTSEECEEMFR
jgi:hypothetical protein